MVANDSSVFDVAHPVQVLYCGVCRMPAEYCEFGPNFESCKPWLRTHAAFLYPSLFCTVVASAADAPPPPTTMPPEAATATVVTAADVSEDGSAALTSPSFHQGTVGEVAQAMAAASVHDDASLAEQGAGEVKKKSGKSGKKAKEVVQKVIISTVERGRRKMITIVLGLDSFPEIKLKDAAKALGKKFACGASVGDCSSNPQKKEVLIQGDVAYDLPVILHELFQIPLDKIVTSN
jgi:density-regulated protein DRP1